jgi:hypothetical protein
MIMLVTGARILKKQYGRYVSVGTLRTVDCVMPHVLQRMISAAMPVETISTNWPGPDNASMPYTRLTTDRKIIRKTTGVMDNIYLSVFLILAT